MKQRAPGSFLQETLRFSGLLLLGCALAGLLWPGPVYADGGAPNLAYVAGAGQGVGVVDIAQQRMTHNFAVQGSPSMLLLSPDGSLLYVAQPATGNVVALAAKTGQAVCHATFPGHPSLLALSVDATVLYVAGLNEKTLQALNAQTCAQEQTFQAPEPVHWLAAALSNAASAIPQTQLWIAGASSVSILSALGDVLGSIPVAGDPQYLCLPGALTAYVVTRQGSVVAIDILTQRVIATLLTGGVFGSMDYNAVTGEIYVPDQRKKQVDVLTPVLSGMALLPHEPADVIPVAGSPQAVAITSDGQFGFVALSNGQIVMLDIPGKNTLKTISVGGNPRFVITGAYPPALVPRPVVAEASPLASLLPALLVAVIGGAGIIGGLFWFGWWRRKQRFSRENAAKNEPDRTSS